MPKPPSARAMSKRHPINPRPDQVMDSLDFFPTPPWATRALCEWLMTTRRHPDLKDLTCWEPACGEHDMVKPLREYFGNVIATDIYPHRGGHELHDFLFQTDNVVDYIITNPPFSLGDQFVLKGIERSTHGCAFFVRTAFLESVGRYHDLFKPFPPSEVLQFSERVPIVKGRLDRTAASATSVCWIVYRKKAVGRPTHLHWIPPCRKRLERDSDYEEAPPEGGLAGPLFGSQEPLDEGSGPS